MRQYLKRDKLTRKCTACGATGVRYAGKDAQAYCGESCAIAADWQFDAEYPTGTRVAVSIIDIGIVGGALERADNNMLYLSSCEMIEHADVIIPARYFFRALKLPMVEVHNIHRLNE